MKFDVKALLRDKKLVAGLVVAAGVGAVVFVRRRQAGGTDAAAATATQTSSTGTSGTYTGVSAGTAGTDLASWMSTYTDAVVKALTPATSTTVEPVSTKSVLVQEGTDVESWLKSNNTTLQQLLALNPNVADLIRVGDAEGYVSERNPATGQTHTVFNTGLAPAVLKL